MINYDFPPIIEVQFHNFCNANCTICPYEKYSQQTNLEKMAPGLKEKILQEIIANQHRIDRLIPYSNNEPFLDKDYLSLLSYIKKHAPSIEIEVSTNLSAFNTKVFTQILSNNLIDDLRISFFGGYEDTYKQLMPKLDYRRNLENLRELLSLKQSLQANIDVQIIMILLPSIDAQKEADYLKKQLPGLNPKIRYFGYLDRAGENTIFNQKIIQDNEDYKLSGCSLKRNEERMCISVNGNIPLCSQDWFGKVNLGNVNFSSIEEIWLSKTKENIDQMIFGQKKSPCDFICKSCKLIYVEKDGSKRLNFLGDKYMNMDDTKKIQAA